MSFFPICISIYLMKFKSLGPKLYYNSSVNSSGTALNVSSISSVNDSIELLTLFATSAIAWRTYSDYCCKFVRIGIFMSGCRLERAWNVPLKVPLRLDGGSRSLTRSRLFSWKRLPVQLNWWLLAAELDLAGGLICMDVWCLYLSDFARLTFT